MVEITNSNALDSYTSYSLAWLAPILYPLSIAMVVFLILAFFWIRDNKRPRHRVIDMVSGFVVAVELMFTICCLIQCSINYSTRSYAGGSTACAVQGFYSTLYAFGTLGAVVLALGCSYRILTTGHLSWTAKQAGLPMLAITVGALVIACFPLWNVGSYIFAVDYCMYDLEGTFYQVVFMAAYSISLVLIAFFLIAGYVKAVDHEAKRKSRYLFLLGLFWFVVWLPAVIIWGFSVAGNDPSTGDWWRLYGANAIILHSQQLGNMIFYGYLWRRWMYDYLTKTATVYPTIDFVHFAQDWQLARDTPMVPHNTLSMDPYWGPGYPNIAQRPRPTPMVYPQLAPAFAVSQ